jgi:hypothetical protein
MQASLQAASDLTAVSKDAGGLEKMVGDAMKMVSDMGNTIAGGQISKDQETTIRNKLKASIKNVSINENNIKNIIENTVNTNIVQNTTSSCKSNINANNAINIDGLIAAKNGGKISVMQSALVDSLAKCVIDAANTGQISKAIITEGALGVVNDNQNTNKQTTEGTADAKVAETKIQESGMTSVLNNLTPGGILASGGSALGGFCFCFCCLFIVLAVGAAFMKYKQMKK